MDLNQTHRFKGEDRGWQEGGGQAGIFKSFSGQPRYSKNFYLNWCYFQHIYPKNPIQFQQVSKLFPTKSLQKSLNKSSVHIENPNL